MFKRLLFIAILVLTAFSLMESPPPPPGDMGPYLNGVFSDKIPGASGAWTLEDPWPNLSIAAPLRIIPFPGTEDVLVLSKLGEVWRVSFENQTQELILDIKDRAFEGGEAGTTGIALHPEFGNPAAPEKQLIFIYYRHKPSGFQIPWEEGFNRLSKFRWDEGSGTFDADTEEILFQQYDRNTWHNGGAMFFHPEDGFLYLAVGDEGNPKEGEGVNIEKSTQRLDRALMSGLLRIDVDNDPTRSHPIRRQPQPAEWGPPDPAWGDTYSQGYSIPNDNPWQNTDGSILEEFYAIGIRSPYSVSYDAVGDRIWLSDVGYVSREEISFIEKEDNLQWPYMEGDTTSELLSIPEPDNLIGFDKEPIHSYGRDFGGCIIGGSVYHGNLYPDLYGKYLFADYNTGRIMTLDYDEIGQEAERDVLIYNIETLGLDLPAGNGITGIFPMPNGDVLLTLLSYVNDGVTYFKNPGKILRLKAQEITPDPATLLSELGVFTNMNTLEVADGIIPFTVNTPLWSDRALKKRWMAIPNDGDFDTPSERIQFSSLGDWLFPEGTVFIKHFDLPVSDNMEENVKLETRFFIVGKEGRGYGLTYKWNEEGTDAVLLPAEASQDYTLYENGVPAGTQTWDFPSRGDCLSCHTSNANYILGVKTYQLNGTYDYPEAGVMNQLDYLSQLGILDQSVPNPNDQPRGYAIDDETADLSLRIRSYLDANCASCHRPGGILGVNMDFRFQVPLHLQNIINQPTQSSNSDADRLLVKPGYHAESEIWVRDASLSSNQMPPLARSIIHDIYIEKLAEWIDGLPVDAGAVNELILYPNPTTGWLGIRINDDWEGPFEAEIYSIKGQLIETHQITNHSHFLNMTTAEKGTYILRLSSQHNEEVSKFVVR
ncbi:MAG: PQQ-dependent sugar dehydrogenase [Chitinophagales bacterium]|nr:PQQ-dependent sugar dehydrogenase [Chitinophagales bacterium]